MSCVRLVEGSVDEQRPYDVSQGNVPGTLLGSLQVILGGNVRSSVVVGHYTGLIKSLAYFSRAKTPAEVEKVQNFDMQNLTASCNVNARACLHAPLALNQALLLHGISQGEMIVLSMPCVLLFTTDSGVL